jgi:hypothetical protein
MAIVQLEIKSITKEKNTDDFSYFVDRAGGSVDVADQRIGHKSVVYTNETSNINVGIEDDYLGGTRGTIGTINFGLDEDEIKEFKFGKDIKNIKDFFRETLSPNVSLTNGRFFNDKQAISHIYQNVNFGQNSLFKTFNREKQKSVPFEDIIGIFTPQKFIESKNVYDSYPNLFNLYRDLDKFREPDIAANDGAIDVMEVRGTKINTMISDMQIRGARGLFGVGNWELGCNSTDGKKGSPRLTELIEYKQSNNDFFEDAQEGVFSEQLIPGSVYTFSLPGFVSSNNYKIIPFDDTVDYFKDKYNIITDAIADGLIPATAKEDLLLSGSRSVSEIGTRFKSRQNGFIMTPFYKRLEQNNFGVDSIAFSGLLKG